MAQPIATNACCSNHIISLPHINQVGVMIDNYIDNDGKSNAQNRSILHQKSVKILLRNGNNQYKNKHPLPEIITDYIKSKYPINSLIRKLILSCIATVTLTFIGFMIIINVANTQWHDYNLGASKEGWGGCERVRDGEFMKEHSNSSSNLGFVIVGEIIFFFFLYDIFNPDQNPLYQLNILTKYPIWTFFYVILCIHIGVASFLFHSSLEHNAERDDISGIYQFLIWCHFYGFFRYSVLHSYITSDTAHHYSYLCSLGIILCGFLAYHYKSRLNSFIVVPFSAIIIMIKCGYFLVKTIKPDVYVNFYFEIIGFGFIIIGFICRQIDNTFWCDPDSWFQFHALFHVLVSIGLLFSYLKLRPDATQMIEFIRKDSKSAPQSSQDDESCLERASLVMNEEQLVV